MDTVSLSLDVYNELRSATEVYKELGRRGEVFYCEAYYDRSLRIITKDEAVIDMAKRLQEFVRNESRDRTEVHQLQKELVRVGKELEEIKQQLAIEKGKRWYRKIFK